LSRNIKAKQYANPYEGIRARRRMEKAGRSDGGKMDDVEKARMSDDTAHAAERTKSIVE
jgi:hypothetical protein